MNLPLNRKRSLLVHTASLLTILSVIGASGCGSLITRHVEYEVIKPEKYPILRAVGYASIDAQPSNTQQGKMLMALKASKLEAYRELAEQVYGQQIDGGQTLANLALQNDQLSASVEGVIRGARVVKSYAVGEDTYVTELQLDMEEVQALYLSVVRPTKLKDVRYY